MNFNNYNILTSMKFKYPVYQPLLTGNEKKYVNECLDSTWISSKGKFITLFEENFAEFIGAKYAAAVPNGTIALHLALLTLGIGEGDEVIVPTLTYIASVNAIQYTGATPVFVDSVKDTWQIDTDDIKRKMSVRTKAIMPVHLYGNSCDMDEIINIAKENDLFIIEDCAEAIGTKYKNKHVGTFGDIAAFSFFGNKTITTGEGGMVVMNEKSLYEKCFHIKGQGLAKDREYWHDIIGYNYRMTNICAAIGLAQLENVEEVIEKKRNITSWYNKYLSGSPVITPAEETHIFNTYWMYNILVKEQEDRDKLRNHLKDKGVETRPMFFPIHLMKMYYNEGTKFPVAEDISLRGINLPSYPGLSESDVKSISQIIRDYFN